MISHKFGPAGPLARAGMLVAIQQIGLSPGLKLCLDAGDINSWPGSGQKWLDVSGNGHDFFRGASGSAAGDDPTFTGTAGRQSGDDYWSHDGGDYFQYDAANEVWMNNLHKNNAVFAIAAWINLASLSQNNPIFANNDQAGTIGTTFYVFTDGRIVLAVGNGTTTVYNQAGDGFTVPANTWTFVGVTMNEASDVATFIVNALAENNVGAYASPTASDASNVYQIGRGHHSSNPSFLLNGSRVGSLAVWEGIAPSIGSLRLLFQETRGKYGV